MATVMGRKLTLLVAAAIIPTLVLGQRNAVPTDPAKLLVIDCLLPGQVRQLGGQRTFLTARRPARLSATECEIRGGEYVAYDRANYETALAFWLPQAELGDPEAQAYVAEIYEKGLGTAPDYVLAAQWYQKAADQGFERAQLSLAYLYEQGLGVTQDRLKALNLYREATGVSGDDLTYESEVTSARVEAQRIIDSLTAQLEDQNEALETLQAELAYTQSRLQERRTELQAAHSQVSDLEAQLATLERTAASPARAAELERLEAALRDREQQLAWRQREVAELETESAERRARLSQSFQEAADRDAILQARLVESDTERQALTEQLAQAQQALYSTEQQVAELTAALAEQRSQLASDREQLLRESTSTSDTQRQALASREARLAEQQAQIAALQAEQRNHLSTITGLREQARAQASAQQSQEAELESARAQLVSAQQRLLETEQNVADLTGQLRQEREQIALERQQLDRRQQATDDNQRRQIEALYQQLSTREARLAEQQTLIDTLQEESRYYVEQIAQLRSQQEPTMAMRSIGASASEIQIAPTRNLARDLDLGDYHALIIGNNSYDHLPRLDTAINDAQALEDVLRDKYGFQTRLLINATRADILVALNEYRASLEPEDSLLIYYAGHGELDQRNLRGYWLPVNAERNNTTEWISDQMITDQISLMAARHVLVVADSCYSGVMTRNSGLRLVAKGGEAAELKRLEKLAKLPSRTVLTSGGEQPVLDGGGGAHSIFANHLIEILTRNERVLEGSSLYDTLFDRVRGGAAQFGIDQSPRYSMLADAGHLNGEFLFVPSI
jgi:predicted  nucleic acid-binding Zn-ribbon protein